MQPLDGKAHKLAIELYRSFSHKHAFIIMMGNFKVTLVKRIIFTHMNAQRASLIGFPGVK